MVQIEIGQQIRHCCLLHGAVIIEDNSVGADDNRGSCRRIAVKQVQLGTRGGDLSSTQRHRTRNSEGAINIQVLLRSGCSNAHLSTQCAGKQQKDEKEERHTAI